jgi:hypothetical protein
MQAHQKAISISLEIHELFLSNSGWLDEVAHLATKSRRL